MALPLELGGIHDPTVRRALEQLALQFPIVATGGGGGGAPSGPAGGVLGGTYPNPGFAADMATQAELDTHTALTTTAHGGIVASTDPRLTDARTPTAHKASHEPGGTDALTGLTNASIAAAAGIAKTKLANLDIVNADVNAAAAIAEAKLNLATDAAAGTGSRRTLGSGALQAAAGNDARLSDARTPTAHTHPAADVVSGVLAVARLGSGTPASGTYVDGGTGAWTTLPAGGSGVGTIVAYQEYTANVTISATTDATANTIVTAPAFTPNGTDTYWIDFYSFQLGPTTGTLTFVLFDGSTAGTRIAQAAAGDTPLLARRRITPSAASHTYSIRAFRTTANGTVLAGTGAAGGNAPGYICVTRAS